jgi:transposase
MARALSIDLRRRVVEVIGKGRSRRQAAMRAAFILKTVAREPDITLAERRRITIG